jgi:transcriptional antiterminator NusG
MDEQSQARWYVVHTYSGYEGKVGEDIRKSVENNKNYEGKVLDVCIPSEEVTEIRRGKKYKVSRKFFPGYVLVKMVLSNETRLMVRNTRGVTGFVGPGGEPVPLTDAEFERMTSYIPPEDGPKYRLDFEVGDNVLVRNKEGGIDIEGVVESIDPENNKATVYKVVLNKKITLECDIADIKPIGKE